MKLITMISETKHKIIIYVTRCQIHVASLEETLKKILDEHSSISRFGDGEFYIIEGNDIGFQTANKLLSERLREVIYSNNDKLLIGIGNAINPKNYGEYTDEHQKWLRKNFTFTIDNRLKYLNTKKIYYNNLISRFWIPFRDKERAKRVSEMLKKVWRNRNVVIIEGEKTRMAVGNDLLEDANSVRRIVCPAENAFEYYDEILKCAISFSKDSLFLIALGPTATVLAYDLCIAGYQALDIGHVDLEYEWMKAGVQHQILISNKYVNELNGGKNVAECEDKLYLSQIACKIGV